MFVGIALVAIAGSMFMAGTLLAGRLEHAFTRDTLLAPEARAAAPPAATVDGPLNFLLIGSDARPSNPTMGARADTIIVLHVPRTMDRAVLLSVPRDLLVDIPPFAPAGFPGERTKINAAFHYGGSERGGAQLLSETLTRLTGVRFDGAAVVDFGGLRDAVRVLGGVRLCVDVRTVSIHTNAVFEPGCRRMSPPQVLDYLRQRENLADGDFGRQRHQQQFLKAVLAEAMTQGVALNPVKANRLIQVVADSMVLDTGGASVPDLIFGLRGIRPDRLTGLRLPSFDTMIGGTSYVVAAEPAASELFVALRSDTLERWAAANPQWVNRI
jgi:LCP family protein required for cell wall assembly